jgi:hypothetical protein
VATQDEALIVALLSLHEGHFHQIWNRFKSKKQGIKQIGQWRLPRIGWLKLSMNVWCAETSLTQFFSRRSFFITAVFGLIQTLPGWRLGKNALLRCVDDKE